MQIFNESRRLNDGLGDILHKAYKIKTTGIKYIIDNILKTISEWSVILYSTSLSLMQYSQYNY